MNITIPLNINEGYTSNPITRECFNWCREQSIVHANKLTIEGISIVVLALIVLFIYYIYWSFEEYIDFYDIDKNKIRFFVNKLPEFSIYLLLGFLAWFIWFS